MPPKTTPERAALYVGDLLRMAAAGLAVFLSYWVNSYILPLNDKLETQAKSQVRLEEQSKNAAHDRKRMEREIDRLRSLHISGK